MKSLTKSIFKFFVIISNYEVSAKICLSVLLDLLKKSDGFLLDFYKNKVISSYTTLSFAEKICKTLEELFDIWVVSDNLA